MRALAISGLVSALLVLHLIAGLAVGVAVVGWTGGVRLAERT